MELGNQVKQEVLNIIINSKGILNIDNTISYLWVADVSGREYAVPNYLTARQLNFKLSVTF